MINVHRFIRSTRAEGPGRRACVWFQGCSRRCKGCFATDTHSFESRTLMSAEEIAACLEGDEGLEGITVLGGEPFEQAHELAGLLQMVRALGRSSIVFTGYTIEELRVSADPDCMSALGLIDVLIDGAYDEDKRSFDVPLIGSSNQRFIFLTDRYKMSDFKGNTIEIIIDKNGVVRLNGMGDLEKIADNEVM